MLHCMPCMHILFFTESGKDVSAYSAVGSDILNNARWLSQNTEVSFASYEVVHKSFQNTQVSFASYEIVHESSPLQPGGFFRSLIPYDKDGNILSPIAKLECSTPREQSSDGLLMKGI